MELAESIDGPTISTLRSLASEHNVWLLMGGFHEKVIESSIFLCLVHFYFYI